MSFLDRFHVFKFLLMGVHFDWYSLEILWGRLHRFFLKVTVSLFRHLIYVYISYRCCCLFCWCRCHLWEIIMWRESHLLQFLVDPLGHQHGLFVFKLIFALHFFALPTARQLRYSRTNLLSTLSTFIASHLIAWIYTIISPWVSIHIGLRLRSLYLQCSYGNMLELIFRSSEFLLTRNIFCLTALYNVLRAAFRQ